MSRLLLTSDLHLGHENILKFRDGFSSQEDHDNTLFDNLASSVNKRDSIIFLGDIAFSIYWLKMIESIKCAKKTLILGNHDLERGINIEHLMMAYDRIESLYSKRNMYFSHCPIHPSQFRGKTHNIHGHLHNDVVEIEAGNIIYADSRYINICVEQTNYKPVAFKDI